MSTTTTSFTDRAQSILFVSLGHDACALMSCFALPASGVVHRFYVDAVGSDALPTDRPHAAMACTADAHTALMRTAAQGTLVHLPPAWWNESTVVALVCDLSTEVGRHASLVWAQAMQVLKKPVFVIALTPRLQRGAASLQAAHVAYTQIKALCPSTLLLEGARLPYLTDATPYVHHAARILVQILQTDAQSNIDFVDLAEVLRAGDCGMGASLVPVSETLASDLVDDVVRGPLLSEHELATAKALLVVVQARQDTFKLAHSRAVLQQLNAMAPPSVTCIYGACYGDYPPHTVGLTVIAAF